MNKYYIQKAARILSPALYYSQAHLLTKVLYSGIGHILMFHRVLPESQKIRIHNHESLEITPQQLEQVITFFKERNYEFISLDDFHLRKNNSERKFVIFTFDDGYIDNYLYAYPIFKKHNIPFTIYVATNMPEGTARLWWYFLEDLIVDSQELKFQIDGKELVYQCNTLKEKEIAFNEIRNLFVNGDKLMQQSLIETLFKDNSLEPSQIVRALSMSWDQIKKLSEDPLVTIGSHTINHYPLNELSYDESKFEIQESKRILETHISKKVNHFCYPIGSYGRKEIEIMKTSDFLTATTIKMANLQNTNYLHPFTLPRIMINSLTTQKLLTLQVNGLLPAIRNKFKRAVY